MTLHDETAIELLLVREAIEEYEKRVAEIQSECDHPTILKYTSSNYITYRACEECGYHESAQWDSGYKYKDQRLLKRSYSVSWKEYYRAIPREISMLKED